MNILKNQIFCFRYFFLLIIFLIFSLLFEGVIHHYYQIFSYYFYSEFRHDRGGYNSFFWEENGIVEFAQAIILLLSIIILFRYIKFHLKNLSKTFQIILIMYLIGLMYYFLEEISYGQHLFFWSTPEFFIELNSQNETNFHNISNLLNELPRTFLLLFCCFSFFFEKLIRFKSKNLAFFIFPNLKLKYLSFLILFFVIPDLITDIFDIKPFFLSWEIDKHPWIFLVDLTQLITFNFIRLSELHELLFNLYIISHIYYLKNFFNLRDIK